MIKDFRGLRLYIGLLAACLGLYACTTGQGGAAENGGGLTQLTIIFAGELEGFITPCDCREGRLGGLARRATFLKQEREKDPHLLLFESGDSFVNYKLPKELKKNHQILEIFQTFRYDGLVPGESEFQLGPEKLGKAAKDLALPFVGANIFLDPDYSRPMFEAPYLIKETGGLRIGISGLFNPDLNKTRLGKQVADLYFRDPADTCREIVEALESEGCTFVVILGHVGQALAKQIVEEVEGIDLFIVGHGRLILLDPRKENKSYLVQVEDRGRKIGKLQVTVNDEGIITSIRQDLIKLNESYEEDVEIKKRIDDFYESLRPPKTAPQDRES